MAYAKLENGELAEVPSDLFNIVKEIEFRWFNLRVQYANPDRTGINDPPFRIIEDTMDGPVQVLAVWELNQSVIDKLHMMNSHSGIDIQAEMEKANAKAKADLAAKDEEAKGSAFDILQSSVTHFNKGKLQFNYTNEDGEKRIVKEGYNGPKETKVM